MERKRVVVHALPQHADDGERPPGRYDGFAYDPSGAGTAHGAGYLGAHDAEIPVFIEVGDETATLDLKAVYAGERRRDPLEGAVAHLLAGVGDGAAGGDSWRRGRDGWNRVREPLSRYCRCGPRRSCRVRTG